MNNTLQLPVTKSIPPKRKYPISEIWIKGGFMTEEERNYLNFKAGFGNKVSKPDGKSVFFDIYQITKENK